MTTLIVREFAGLQDYGTIWSAMQAFTTTRNADTPDEIWLLEHQSVYTQGQAGDDCHLLSVGDTPVVRIDRGGQITWHGPGQLMIYTLLDTRRLKLGPKSLVHLLETVLIVVLASWGIPAYARDEAPGVYVGREGREAKLAALGLRIRQRGCYHGVALNVDCDLAAFRGINPCGHAGMAVTRLSDLLDTLPSRALMHGEISRQLAQALHCANLQYVQMP